MTSPDPSYYAKHFTHLPIHMFAGLNQLTTGECLDVLRSIGLPQHCSMFESNQVDGPMLEALIHPHLGQQIMLSLGVNDTSDRHRLVTELYRLKAHGYICNRHIATNSSFWRYSCSNPPLEGYKCLHKLGYYKSCIMSTSITSNDKFTYLQIVQPN